MSHPFAQVELLNEEQRAAVLHGEGPLLVVAGAGTGKTRVITERIRALLEAHPELSGENILGLTFTQKAAGEMKQRVVASAGERGKQVWLGTFHAFCLEVVLAELRPGVRVLEEIDHWILLRRRLADLELKHYLRLADPGQFLNDFLKFFSRCQDELVTPEEYQRYADAKRAELEAARKQLDPEAREERESEAEKLQEVARAYRVSDRLLREENLASFGMAQLDAVGQLRAHPEALARLRERFHYVLVDEFQDTNIAQIELLALLAGDRRNIVAVGDDDQAIYRFRGASFGSFKLFAEKFLGPGGGTRQSLALTRNYRSTQRILRVAGQSIRQNRDRYLPNKELRTENAEGEKIRVAEFGSAEEEARWTTEELTQGHAAGRRWGSFAVLYRRHTDRDALVERLRRAGIPFVIKNLSILSHPLVRDVIAYLRLIEVPSDSVACARVLAAPYWGLEPADLVRLAQRAARGKARTLLEEASGAKEGFALAQASKRVAELVAWLGALRQRANRCAASELLDELIGDLGLGLAADDPDRRYLDAFASFVCQWEEKSKDKKLADFIAYLEYFFEAGGAIPLEEEAPEDAVQLMTVHAAKGLEFDHVFLLRLTRGSFPPRAKSPLLEFPVELMKEEKPQGDFRIQEERRLFYVALTRARRGLTLTTVVGERRQPSPFLEDFLSAAEIKRRDVEQLAPKLPVSAEEPKEAAGRKPRSRPLFGRADRNTRAFSRIAEWARSYRPPLAEPLQLSASAIDAYKDCPQRYLLGQTWGLRGGPHAAITFGNVMHTTIRQAVGELRKGRPISFEDVAGIYVREWPSAAFRDPYQEEEYRKAGLDQLRAFWESYRAAPADVIAQEKVFELAMEPDVVVTGRIDQINRLGSKQAEIVDYKTGRPKTLKDTEKSLQLSLYALAVGELVELEPTRLVFYNLTTNEAVATARDAKSLAGARQAVAEVADQIRAGEFDPRPGFVCRSCEFRSLCPAHEQGVTRPPAGTGRQ